jgi:AraC family transcriptional activator of pobA
LAQHRRTTPLPGTDEPIRAEAFDTGLRARTIALAGGFDGPSWRILHLVRGTADIVSDRDGAAFSGPVLILQPWTAAHRLRLGAGTTGVHLLVGPAALADAIGGRTDPTDLRRLSEVRTVVALADHPDTAARIGRVTADLMAEVAARQPGWHGVAEAYLRVLLVHLWRAAPTDPGPALRAPAQASVFARFRGLVEAHVRDRWTVAQYADALGVTADRLTDICRRSRGLTPHQIITARAVAEAQRLLATSDAPLDRIAAQLGFATAAQFNRFFSTAAGLPPGRWRATRAGRPGPAPAAQPGNPPALFDWP